MLKWFLIAAGFVLLIAGGLQQVRATAHLLPEFRDWRGATLYWRPERYAPDGRRLVQRGWVTQLAGLAAWALAARAG